MGEALIWIVDTSEQYTDCRAKVKAFIKIHQPSK